jgi:hypothetical protein
MTTTTRMVALLEEFRPTAIPALAGAIYLSMVPMPLPLAWFRTHDTSTAIPEALNHLQAN